MWLFHFLLFFVSFSDSFVFSVFVPFVFLVLVLLLHFCFLLLFVISFVLKFVFFLFFGLALFASCFLLSLRRLTPRTPETLLGASRRKSFGPASGRAGPEKVGLTPFPKSSPRTRRRGG